MGCALSSSGTRLHPGSSEAKRCPAPAGNEGMEKVGPLLLLSKAQKRLVRESWDILHKDIARIGVVVFIRLFETHPECKDAFFLFREAEDLQQLKRSKDLQAHGLRVMSFIEKSVARLDQEEKLRHLTLDLGRSHFHYQAPPKYYEYIGTQFIQAVQPLLKEEWTPEVEEAWQSLFQFLVATMCQGYYAEEEDEETVQGIPSLHHSEKADVESFRDKA